MSHKLVAESVEWFLADALGSITDVTGENGAVVERYEHDAFGGAVTIYDGSWATLTGSAIGSPCLFTGRRYVLCCALAASSRNPRSKASDR